MLHYKTRLAVPPTEARPLIKNRFTHRPRRAGALSAAAALVVGGLAVFPIASYAAGNSGHDPFLKAITIKSYGNVIANSKGMTLYGLSSDSLTHLACTGTCLKYWPPVLVGSKATVAQISLGQGVSGTVGFVSRGSHKQVTFDGYPLYRFAGDKKAGQANGEGVNAFGGTWGLLHASNLILPAKKAGAKTASANNPVKKSGGSGSTTATTTSGGSGW